MSTAARTWLSTPVNDLHASTSPVLQRNCAACAEAEEKDRTEARLARSTAGLAPASAQVHVAPPIVRQVLRRPGEPLDGASRQFFESRLGHRLDHVRVHRGDEAADSAAAVGAHAYTVGRHVVLGRGFSDPASRATRHLLAHELTHVIQQRGAEIPSGDITIGPRGDALEHAADGVADAVMSGQVAPRTGESADAGMQRLAIGSTGTAVLQRGECDQAGRTPRERCAVGRRCGYGKSGTCNWGGITYGCRCYGASQPTTQRVLEVLLIVGLSLALIVTVIIALADPEPATKLAAAGLSVVEAVTLLVLLGYSDEQIRNMGLDPSLAASGRGDVA